MKNHIIFDVIFLYFFYLLSSISQEFIYGFKKTNGDNFDPGTFYIIIKSLTNILVSQIAVFLTKSKSNVVLNKDTIFMSLSRSMGSVSSLCALSFISYPSVVLGRSCKIIPVFISEYLFCGKQLSYYNVISVFFTTMGMIIFSLKPDTFEIVYNYQNMIGCILILIALFSDGFMAVYQNKMLNHNKKPGAFEMMGHVNKCQLILSVCLLFLHFDITDYYVENKNVFVLMIVSSTLESIAQSFLYKIVVKKGTLFTVFITTLRKFITILCSILFFKHYVSVLQYFSIVLVFIGIYIELYHKSKNKPIVKSTDKMIDKTIV